MKSHAQDRDVWEVTDWGDSFPDLSYTALSQIQAKDLEDGMWCIHNKSGMTGQVQNYHKVISGKRAKKKIVYDLKFPHNHKTVKESVPAKTMVRKCKIQNTSYLVSHIERTPLSLAEETHAQDRADHLVFGYIRIGSGWDDGMCHIIRLCLRYFYEKSYKYDLVYYDAEYQAMEIPIPSRKQNHKLHSKILFFVESAEVNRKDCYLQMLQCPKVIGSNRVIMIQMVWDISIDDGNEVTEEDVRTEVNR